jgi:crotonobetainyl-CoA:carnitine CoA-transferase CaiB-like acyl-CoA transferase
MFGIGEMTMTDVLDDLKVLDLSWGIAGPMTTMLLADHGAAVTKIEPPGGDPFRCQSGYREAPCST